MKKIVQLLIVVALVLTVVGVARSGAAWASSMPASAKLALPQVQPVNVDRLSTSVDITESGEYSVGGICTITVDYKVTGLADQVDVNVPLEISSQVPFPYEDGPLFLPGCHVVHLKADKVVDEASSDDGSWNICFGNRPDEELTIYYYLDNTTEPVWAPLPTTIADGLACAPAMSTGVYAPASRQVDNKFSSTTVEPSVPVPDVRPGSILPPPPSYVITESGKYSAAGGVCGFIVEYKIAELGDDLHVQYPLEASDSVPFPNDGGLLYLPGCHVLHFKDGEVVDHVTEDEGQYTICFAAPPGKETTIYYYSDDNTSITAPWTALETTTQDGQACAPANHSAVYAPAGK